ncbi:TonB-dependent receptor [Leptolyngbya sp. FACHB-17]|uniref:TonB-dependent receptor plug domain-containing protein n=1 Tax=unclassified Leptolyngbya TaxID=2650499 RepID=UPI00168048CC|nr:TonB-dependent receptor [Leptolyngbya sp. FACHB-17]MBD2079758.1 TonB-dependent receptor [Leptolyngbya sp. FACHB-17]
MKFHSLGIAFISGAAWFCTIIELSYSSEASANPASDHSLKNVRISQPSSTLANLRDFQKPLTDARLLQFDFSSTSDNTVEIAQESQAPDSQAPDSAAEEEEEEIIGVEKLQKPTSTPVYTIDSNEIRRESSDSLAEILRGLPGFAVNDVGFGADIHTGTFYRGASINQSVFLLNGRPIGTNVNIYHGGTDLNSIPTGAIEQVELSSGTAATLYGSEAIGGVVNVVTKKGTGLPQFNGFAQLGSFSSSNYRGIYSGSFGDVNYLLSYQRFKADNDYRVPVGAANRGLDGRLFNGDSTQDNYYGNLSFDLGDRNSVSLDVSTVTSRRGLLYFGFPLQRDRLDHDTVNVGLAWKALLGNRQDSTLNTTLSFNQDYFSTYGPTQTTFFRRGILNSRGLNARVEHNWQTSKTNNLRWGVDLQNSLLNGEAFSTLPQLARFNGEFDRDRIQAALFALNTWQITNNFQAEFGLRQNFTSEFGSYLNPSVGARWALSSGLALRGSWGSVHRNPGLDQLYAFDTVHNWLPNPDLKPEIGSSWTAGLDVQLAKSFAAQFTYFGSRLNDRIAVQSGQWTNVGLVNTNGIEAALRWQVSPQWSTFVNYTYTDAKIGSGAERGLQLSTIPFSVARFGIGYASNGWEVNLYANYFSGARRALFTLVNDNPREFSPSWISFDLGLRIPVTRGLGLTVFLENLADRSYEKVNRIYQPGLTYRIGLVSDF